MLKIIKNFFREKTLFNAIPRYIIFVILNLKYLKKYKTLNGSFYLPLFAFQDVIRNSIINNKIYEEKVYNAVKKHIKPNSIVLDIGSNYGQMSILWSKVKPGVQVYSFEASNNVIQYTCQYLKGYPTKQGDMIKLYDDLVLRESEYTFADFNIMNFITVNHPQLSGVYAIDLNSYRKVSMELRTFLWERYYSMPNPNVYA